MKRKTTESFIKEAQKIHGNKFNYSKTDYINCRTKVCIICPEHGEFWIRPDGHLKGSGCPKCGYKKIGEKLKLTKEEFIERAQKIHGNKYDYSKVKYIDSFSPIEVICPIHGSFYIRSSAHTLQGEGCSKCADDQRRKTVEQFIKEASKIHSNKYIYDKVKYISKDTKVIITCPIHGDFEQTPGNHLYGHGCPICKDSIGEKQVLNYLISNSIPFERQAKIFCPEYVRKSKLIKVDFYGEHKDQKYIIEYNGRQHYQLTYFGEGGKFQEQQARDEWLRDYCKDNGIRLLEIPYNENSQDLLLKFFESF